MFITCSLYLFGLYFYSIAVQCTGKNYNKLINKTVQLHGAESFLRSSASQIPPVLWNPKAHCRIHKGPPSAPILSQINSVHACPFHCLKIHFNIIPQSTPAFRNGLFPSGPPTKTLYCTSPVSHTCYMPCPVPSSLFGHQKNIW